MLGHKDQQSSDAVEKMNQFRGSQRGTTQGLTEKQVEALLDLLRGVNSWDNRRRMAAQFQSNKNMLKLNLRIASDDLVRKRDACREVGLE